MKKWMATPLDALVRSGKFKKIEENGDDELQREAALIEIRFSTV